MKKHNPHRLVSVLSKWLASFYAENDFSEKTKVNYQGRYNFIIEYLTETKQSNILISDVNVDFIDAFREYSLTHCDLTHTSRNVKILKAIIDYAVSKNLTTHNQIASIKTKRTKLKEVVYLNVFELQKLSGEGKEPRQRAKDLYLFQAYTGLSYGDLWTFNIVRDSFGEWVTNKRCKPPHNEYWVPLQPEAKEILEKYEGRLPKMKNGNYNEYIREATKELEINKYLTTHTARKTFATIMYERGWSVEALSEMLGNSVQILMKHYIKKSRKRIEYELQKQQLAL